MNMRFEPAGMTDDEEIRFATSIVDYVARKLALEYLPYETRDRLGIFSVAERTATLDAEYGTAPQLGGGAAVADAHAPETAAPAPALTAGFAGSSVPIDADAPMCLDCGIKMQRAGACHVCDSCGATSGCS
jgi:ribonucleoside-diphosphate reductase alpha chain